MSARQEIEDLIRDELHSKLSISVDGNKVSIIDTETQNEVTSITGTSEEDACERMLGVMKIAIFNAKLVKRRCPVVRVVIIEKS